MKLRKISLGRPFRRLLFETLEVDVNSDVLPVKSIYLINMTLSVKNHSRSIYKPPDFDYDYSIDEEGNLL